MSGRTILICGLDYWPDRTGIAVYTTAFAEYLAARGDTVHVIAGMPYYPEWKLRAGYERALRRTETRNGVTLHRYRQHVPGTQSARHRAAYEASFLANTMLPPHRLPKPDLVLGVMPTLADGILAARLAKRHRAPLALWIQDLFGQAALQSGVAGGQRVAGLTARIEGWCARQAEAIAIIAEGFRSPLLDQGVDPARIHRVHNWTHIGQPTMSAAETRAALGWPTDRTICLHAGNMGLKQGLETLIATARLAITERPDVHFVLLGDGNQRPHLEALAVGLPNVDFVDPVADDLFPNALAAADVLLLNQRGSVRDMSLPSKLTSYAAVGRPIVAAVHLESETAVAVRDLDQGIVVMPDDPAALLQAVDAARRSGPTRSPHSGNGTGADEALARVAAVLVDSYLGR